MKPTAFCFSSPGPRRHTAFTLLQVGIVLGVLGIFAALLFPAFGRVQRSAQRQSCDVRLKAIALALDAFKSERGAYPAHLAELQTQGYLTDADALRCPRDNGTDAAGYEAGYITRAPGDGGEMPVVTCPLHEDTGGGNQARLGRFTTQFATRPATLTAGNSVQIQRAGEAKTNTGYAGMPLHGGDRIRVGGTGTALITFADGSTARLQSGAQISVLQSFVDGQSGAPLYTLLRQTLGDATYSVNHGSRFDVVTPAATAGARGTRFRIQVVGARPQDTKLYVFDGKVAFTTPQRTGIAPLNKWLSATLADVGNLLRWLL